MTDKTLIIIWALICLLLAMNVLNRIAIIDLQTPRPYIIYTLPAQPSVTQTAQPSVEQTVEQGFSNLLEMLEANQ